MRSHLSALVFVGVLSAFVAGSLPAAAQPADEPADDAPREDFFDVVDVEIVNVDVWVTDKQGNPVDGLGKDDFVVLRDGEPVEVTNFYAVSDGRPVAAAAAPDAGRPDRGAAAPPSEPEVAPEHRLWLIVYVDNYNIDPIERNRIFPDLRQFLASTLP